MSLTSTEMTIRQLFIKELDERGVRCYPEMSKALEDGTRIQVDLILRNGGICTAQTKVEKESSAIEDAFNALMAFEDANGSFAIIFPEKLRKVHYLQLQERAYSLSYQYTVIALFRGQPATRFVGRLTDTADWISKRVLHPPAIVSVEPSFVVGILQDTVTELNEYFRSLSGETLVEMFGGKDVFDNILQYKKREYPIRHLRTAAVYLIINQLIFYHLLSKSDPLLFSVINESRVSSPKYIGEKFRNVLEVNYAPIFAFDIVSLLPQKSVHSLRKAIKRIRALAPEKIKHDILGTTFHELIPLDIRKFVAAYYTNIEAAELLAWLSIRKADAKVIDLAVGSGTLLVSSYHKKRFLLEKDSVHFDEKCHRQFLERDLTGIDVMPFAAHLALVNLAAQEPLFKTRKARVAVWDSTLLKPGMNIPSISRELVDAQRTLVDFDKREAKKAKVREKGVVAFKGLGGEELNLTKCDVAIMNPPFTRQRRIPQKYKLRLESRLGKYKKYLHGRMGYFAYFVFLADSFLKPQGRIALVLPATALRLDSTKSLREFLIKNYEIEAIVTAWQRSAFSENAYFREILFIARKLRAKNNGNPCAIVMLKKLPKDQLEVRNTSSEISDSVSALVFGESFENERMKVRLLSQNELAETADNLFQHIAYYHEETKEIFDMMFSKEKLTPLEDLLDDLGGRIYRGLEERYGIEFHDMFISRELPRAIKSRDIWVLEKAYKKTLKITNRITRKKLRIPRQSVVYGLRRGSGISKISVSNLLDYVVTQRFPRIRHFLRNEKDTKVLRDWDKYVQVRLCNLAIFWRFDLSAKGTSLFALFSQNLMAPSELMRSLTALDEEDAKLMALWLNSTLNVLQMFLVRVETRGAWMQVPGFVLNRLLVLDPTQISERQKKKLLTVFDKIENVEFPSFLEQLRTKFQPRVDMDVGIMSTLGFKRKESKDLLAKLYLLLVDEIERLQGIMREERE